MVFNKNMKIVNADKIPNLFIIGSSKCGTTSLWNMLFQNSNVFMSDPKEPFFFSFRDYNKRIDWYLSLFRTVTNEKIIGEATPIYSETILIPELPERLYSFNPDAKLIYIVREPIDRLKSVWRQTLSSGHWYKYKFQNYTDVSVSLMPNNFEEAIFKYPPFLEATRYWTHLNNYRYYFNDSQILLLFFEDLKKDPEKVYKTMCDFLEIEPEINPDVFKKKNSSMGKVQDYSLTAYLKKNNLIQKTYRFFRQISGGTIKIPKKKIPYQINISKDLKTQVKSVLSKEIEMILKYGNKPADFWNK